MGLFSRKAAPAEPDKAPPPPAKQAPEAAVQAAPDATQDPGEVSPLAIPACLELFKRFPLGPISLALDFGAGPVQETVLLGYQLDAHRVYVSKKLRESEPQPGVIELDTDDGTISISYLRDLHLMVAIVRDHPSGASEAPVQKFHRGTELFLRSHVDGMGTSQVSARVNKRVALKKGYYQGHQVMLIEPDLATTTGVNHRCEERIESNLDAHIHMDDEVNPHLAAKLMDFTERMHRLEFTEPSEPNPQLDIGAKITYTLEIDESSSEQLSGTITKRRPSNVVVELQGIVAEGNERELTHVMSLGLKTRLVQVGE